MAMRHALVMLGVVSALCLVGCRAASTSTSQSTRRAAASDATSVSPPVSLTPEPTPTCFPAQGAPPGPELEDLAFADAADVWAGRSLYVAGCQGATRDAGQVMASTDGGATWTEQYHGPVVPDVMQFVDDVHGWVAGCKAQDDGYQTCTSALLSTSDGGATWRTVATYGASRITQVDFVSPLDGWVLMESCQPQCGRGNAQLIATLDAGASWHDLSLPETMDPFALQRSGAMHGWVLGLHQLFITDDAGATWRTVNAPGGDVLDFVDAQHGWLGGAGGDGGGMAAKEIDATSDGGNTWRPVAESYYGSVTPQAGIGNLSLDGGGTALSFLDPLDGWLATEGRASFLFYTNDGGHTWQGVASGTPPSTIDQIAFANASDGWAWGNSYLIHTTDGGAQWSQIAIP
jgi:photosystem II stability/assembly factor-like uncharacterized protein